MCEDEGLNIKVALVRFDIESERALMSINVSPSMRGKGKSKGCLRDSIKFFRTNYISVRFIDAQIKSINVASQRSFAGVGFGFVREENDVFYYEYVV